MASRENMDITEQRQTYDGFVKLSIYSTVGVIITLVLLAFFLL